MIQRISYLSNQKDTCRDFPLAISQQVVLAIVKLLTNFYLRKYHHGQMEGRFQHFLNRIEKVGKKALIFVKQKNAGNCEMAIFIPWMFLLIHQRSVENICNVQNKLVIAILFFHFHFLFLHYHLFLLYPLTSTFPLPPAITTLLSTSISSFSYQNLPKKISPWTNGRHILSSPQQDCKKY